MSLYLFMTSSILFTISSLSQVVSKQSETTIPTEYLKFLQDKGYLKKTSDTANSVEDKEDLKKSLRQFQWFSGVSVTGDLNAETEEKFKQPRCGMQDFNKSHRRFRRYVLQGSKWNKKSLSFRILNYTTDLSKKDIRVSIKRALSSWQAATQIRFFEKRNGVADIMIKFSRRNHSDPYPFDGPGGTIGHAFYPEHHSLAGDTHFDDDEFFTLSGKEGKNFYWVALHEFGHALGLEHSNTKGTVMFPWYVNSNDKEVVLTTDDERGIQKLYGTPKRTIQISEMKRKLMNNVMAKLKRRNRNTNCIDRINAIFLNKNGDSVVINNQKVNIFDRHLRSVRGPLFLPRYFKGVKKVDAIYRTKTGLTRIFHGKSFWEFDGVNYIQGPVNVSNLGFPKELHHLDAAFRWSKDNNVYLFKGKKYWKYNETTMELSNSQHIRTGWPGIHGRVNTVFEWRNNHVHFFRGRMFFLFNKNGTGLLPGYPVPVQNNLLRCKRKHLLGFLKEDPTKKTSSGEIRYSVINTLYLFILFMTFPFML